MARLTATVARRPVSTLDDGVDLAAAHTLRVAHRTRPTELVGKDKFAVKDAFEHNQANRDDVDKDNFDFAVTNKNAADTFH